MTGSGTNTDPYLADNWADFVTAVGKSNAYVALTADINMNDIAPQGVSTVVINATNVDGRNHTIYNLRDISSGGVFSNNNANNTIQNLNFKDFIVTYSLLKYSSNGNYFYNCTFTGVIESGRFIDHSRTNVLFYSNSTAGCGFNLSFNNGVMWHDNTTYPLSFRDAKINFINFRDTALINLENCYISGNVIKSFEVSGSKNTVFDCDIPENVKITVSSSSNILINSDKCLGTLSGSGYTLVTTEQLKNAEYLSSIGFPIGVD